MRNKNFGKKNAVSLFLTIMSLTQNEELFSWSFLGAADSHLSMFSTLLVKTRSSATSVFLQYSYLN